MGKNFSKLIGIAFLFAFLLLPLGLIFSKISLFEIPWRLLYNNFLQAFLSALFSIILAFPLAYALRFKTPFLRVLNSITLLPLILPQPVMILALITFFGVNGFFRLPFSLYGLEGILLAHAIYNFPLAARIISSGWSANSELEKISRVLGASKLKTFIFVTIPLLKSSIISAFAVVFAFSFTSFSIPLIFGGISYSTLEVYIFRSFFREFDIPRGAFFALLQVAAFLPIIAIWKNNGFGLIKTAKSNSPIPAIISCVYLVFFIILFAPVFFKSTLTGFEFTIMLNSVLLAFLSALLSVAFWLLIGDLLKSRAFLLFAVSPMVLSASYFFLPYSFLLLPIGHSILSLALIFAIMLPASKEIRKLANASSVFGANGFHRFLHIYLPLAMRPLFLAFAFAFAFSFGETAFISSLSRDFQTMPMVLLQYLSSYRIGQGYFYASIMLISSFVICFILEGLNVFESETKAKI